MIDNIDLNELKEIKQAYSFLDLFALRDSELEIISLITSRVVLGSDNFDVFYEKLKKLKRDEANVKKIAIAIAKSKFSAISGVDEFLRKLGSTEAVEDKKLKEIVSSQPESMKKVQPQTTISFSLEDDEEIKSIIKSSNLPAKNNSHELVADEIIGELGYDKEVSDQVIFKRLRSVIVFRLKDIRDEIETTEILKKGKKIGGLEMNDEQSNKILSLIRAKISSGEIKAQVSSEPLESKPREAVSFPQKQPFPKSKTTIEAKKTEKSQESLKEIEELLKQAEPQKVSEKKVVVSPSKSMPQIEEEDGLPVIKSPQGDELMVMPKKLAPAPDGIKKILSDSTKNVVQSEKKQSTITSPRPLPQPQARKEQLPTPRVLKSTKPTLDGVKVTPTLVGPVEELGTMTMIHFRRLGETPHIAIAKIKEKIDLLEKEAYARKLEGVDAWHKSEINKFYRLLGQESMSQGKSVEDIISERIAQNKPTLSIEEFNSVMELNRMLRY